MFAITIVPLPFLKIVGECMGDPPPLNMGLKVDSTIQRKDLYINNQIGAKQTDRQIEKLP